MSDFPGHAVGSLESVWHYTTAEGLRGIVQSGVLWATSHRFMNDSEEPRYATNVLRAAAAAVRVDVAEEHRERFDRLMAWSERSQLEAFLLCAALEHDLLTVWRGYGASVPYAIELDAREPLLPVEQVSGDEHPSPPSGWGPEVVDEDERGAPIFAGDPDDLHLERDPWTPVKYDQAEALKRVRHIAELATLKSDPFSDSISPWMNLGGIDLLQLKHPAFMDEREARMVFDVGPRWKFVKHRATRFGLTPYIEVSAVDERNYYEQEWGFVTQPAARRPIKSVHIGPSPLGDESVFALREFLEFNGYPDTPVVKSETPFR